MHKVIDAARFRRSLLAWYDANKRDLPWRRTRDPYAICLSEVMLQQTTVRTVEPRWARFLKRWPTVENLAGARLDDVLHEWTGLGYYARARNLHKAARAVVDAHGGKLPRTLGELMALPGMGVYTASAVASIAFGVVTPVVDANVERVMGRLFMIEGSMKSPVAKRYVREIAERLLSTRRPGDFNQGMMELGALVCLPREPRCEVCPVAGFCAARRAGREHEYPRLAEKPKMEAVRECAVVIRRGGKVLLLRRATGRSFGGMWEVPRVRLRQDESERDGVRRAASELTGLVVEPGAELMRVRHTVMRQRIELVVYTAKAVRGRARALDHEDLRWARPEEWLGLPKSTTQAKIAMRIAGED